MEMTALWPQDGRGVMMMGEMAEADERTSVVREMSSCVGGNPDEGRVVVAGKAEAAYKNQGDSLEDHSPD